MSERQNQPLPATYWRPLRLATLLRLRWLAIAGQAASVMLVSIVFDFPLPLEACFGLIGLSAALNLTLFLRFGPGHRLSNTFAALQLGYDSLQLAGLLWLTGGLENPFSLLLLAPVSVSATTLTQKMTALLAGLVACLATILAVSHQPLPWTPEAPLLLNKLYVTGIWTSLLLGVGFIAAYTNRVAHEARQLADALAATELTLSRQQQLSALDGLAAAAAHELGTPLSTISLAAKEMRAEMSDGPFAEDVDLIIAETARCRAILSRLRNLEETEAGGPFAWLPLSELVAEAAKPHEQAGKVLTMVTTGPEESEPVLLRQVGLRYGLGNLIENAVHFAEKQVIITISWQQPGFTVAIRDDGPGFPPDLITRLGDPYLTSRDRDETEPGRFGLGLGIFIAKTLLERTGATLAFRNTAPEGHAEVEIFWPGGLAADLSAEL